MIILNNDLTEDSIMYLSYENYIKYKEFVDKLQQQEPSEIIHIFKSDILKILNEEILMI